MRFSSVMFASMLWLVGLPAVWAQADRPGGLPDDNYSGELKVIAIGGGKPPQPLQLPLRHTDVRIEVSGFVARAIVTQHYVNPFEQPIEAVYTFPLPDQAAVDGMDMTIGGRVIRGLIKKKEEARELYQQAKAAGKRTSLLEQERPNVFTQSVGNIMPGDEIEIEIRYVDILSFRDQGDFELVFPMVVGPRYIPGAALDKAGGGQSPDTDQVADASRITPPVLEPGQRSGHDISLTVTLDAGLPIRGLHSLSHAVDIRDISETQRSIALHASDTLPNKDFILRYQVAGKVPEMTLMAHHTAAGGGFFTFIAVPQQQVAEQQTVPRDLIFVLDTSGSMRGFPLDKAKQAMFQLIDGMRPTDRFNIVRFAGDTGTLWASPQPATVENLALAKRFVDSQRGAGGTEMRAGITEALRQAAAPERLRIAFLLTDGYVGNEAAIFDSIEKERRGARVFTLGVGSSVNRYLLDRAAVIGRGEAFYVRQDGRADEVIERFFRRVDRPALAHLEIDWGELDVSELTPARLPDLWQGQPIMLHGRYGSGGSGEIHISGRLGSQAYSKTLRVELPVHQPEHAVMASVWARAQVKQLMLEMARKGSSETLVEKITQLGLDYRLMTQWTSFVAVEERVVNAGGEQKTVMQPVELPEGVDYDGVFGAAAEATAVSALQIKSRVMPLAPSPAPYVLSAPSPAIVGRAVDSEQTRASGLLNKQEADIGLADKKAEKSVATAACQYRALSVSGGLKYPQVDTVLARAWVELCAKLQGQYQRAATVELELAIAADGSVSKVVLKQREKVADGLLQRLREAFASLRFAPVAGGGMAKITLRLLLQP
jgi:Ca-activated chloride channel family protein